MPFITKEEAFARFQKFGRNSSHFVWFLSDLSYFEASNGWVFGFITRGPVSLFAFEPFTPNGSYDSTEFNAAWAEVREAVRPEISLFVGVYQPCRDTLRGAGFQTLRVGREPYVDLNDCVPTGNSGKGVRAARNQAIRAGVEVTEWNEESLRKSPALLLQMRDALDAWKARNIVDLGGFVNTVNPFEKMGARRYFLARKGDSLEAFLVATPIPGRESYFLEDMIIRPGAARGSGELLTLEAMLALSNTGAKEASLGVVSLTSISDDAAEGLSPFAHWLLVSVPKQLNRIYNVDGLEMFRKHFKPAHWENIFLALENHSSRGCTRAWLTALWALVMSFRPRLNRPIPWLALQASRALEKHPVSYGILFLTGALFGFVNKGGDLPKWALDRFGFTGSAPAYEWIWRTVTSDLLYFDRYHFVISTVLLVSLLRWMETTSPARSVFTLLAAVCLLDDIVNYLVLIKPYGFFHPRLFSRLIVEKDVGTSLWLATLFGFQLCKVRKHREVIFAGFSLGVVLCFVFMSERLTGLIMNLNHFVLLSIGFVVGKLCFRHQQEVSRKVARLKTPTKAENGKAAEPKAA